jgi:hypothetical protein
VGKADARLTLELRLRGLRPLRRNRPERRAEPGSGRVVSIRSESGNRVNRADSEFLERYPTHMTDEVDPPAFRDNGRSD